MEQRRGVARVVAEHRHLDRRAGQALLAAEPRFSDDFLMFRSEYWVFFGVTALQMLFQQYPGLAEVRDVPGKDGIAFVEFGDEMQGTVAMNGLQGFKVTSDDHIRITYAKK